MSTLEEIYGRQYEEDENSDEYGGDDRYEDGGDDRYEDDIEDDKYRPTFEQEVGARGQANMARSCYVGIDLNDPDYNKKIRELSPEDKFKFNLDNFVRNIDKKIQLTVENRDEMCETASRLPTIKYLNPIAYALGYWVTKGGVKIDDKNWKKINTVKDGVQIINIDLKDSNVYPADVIRYARFWINLKGN